MLLGASFKVKTFIEIASTRTPNNFRYPAPVSSRIGTGNLIQFLPMVLFNIAYLIHTSKYIKGVKTRPKLSSLVFIF